MHRSRTSLFYLAGYLFPTGLALLFAPQLVFRMLQSTGGAGYGDVIPRLAGGLLLALGVLVVQIIRHRIDVLYVTVVGVRLMLCGILIGLFVYTHDPFFLFVCGVVAIGLIWTAVAYAIDRAQVRRSRAVAT